MSFRVCMICASHASSPSYQFCCRYTLCPFVLPTGVTQYTSDYSCCTSLLVLFPATCRSSAPMSFWSLMVFIDYSIVHYSSACYSIINYSIACYSIVKYSIARYTIHHSIAHRSIAHCSIAHCSIAHYSIAHYSIAHYSIHHSIVHCS